MATRVGFHENKCNTVGIIERLWCTMWFHTWYCKHDLIFYTRPCKSTRPCEPIDDDNMKQLTHYIASLNFTIRFSFSFYEQNFSQMEDFFCLHIVFPDILSTELSKSALFWSLIDCKATVIDIHHDIYVWNKICFTYFLPCLIPLPWSLTLFSFWAILVLVDPRLTSPYFHRQPVGPGQHFLLLWPPFPLLLL